MKPSLTILAAVLLLSACGAVSGPEDMPAPEAALTEAEGEAAGPAAQAFITQNAAPPEGAADTKGDGVYRDSDGRPFQYALLGDKLPAFSAPVTDGGVFHSAELDRWTVIHVWGSWCGDSQADGPFTQALERAIAQDPDLDFVSIHVPIDASRATPEELYGKHGSLEAYFDAAGYRVPSVVLDNDASVRNLLQISWTPSYLLVSPDGVVRGFRTDLRLIEDQPVKTFIQEIAEVRKDVKALLSPQPSDLD